ncbi:MAG TPA: hypothetical protein VLI21_11615 [Casimicrobiaceae bacterium]|nr:hypothetical protein [Casimicrobiaceae bacterium]
MAVFLKWLVENLRDLPFLVVGGGMMPGVVTVKARERNGCVQRNGARHD